MTALTKYDRLEATGLWRPDPEGQRREVIVSIGNATLIVTDMNDQAITHWSLAAVERANAGSTPAIYHPDGDAGETLELRQHESEMIDAIESAHRNLENTPASGPAPLAWCHTLCHDCCGRDHILAPRCDA